MLIVTHRSAGDAAALARQVRAMVGAGDVETIVVDTSEEPGQRAEADAIPGQVPGVRLLRPDGPAGYYGAARFGLARRTGAPAWPEWTIVSNADVAIPDPRFFADLARLHGAPSPGVVAPGVISELTGRDQNPHMVRRPSNFRMHLLRLAFATYPTLLAWHLAARLKSAIRRPGGWNHPPLPRPVYAPHGAFILFHRAYFERGGTLDHGVTLFGEEIFVAESCRALGLPIVYDPRLQVRHREHVSTGRFPNRRMARLMKEASAWLAKTYFSA